MNRIVLGIAMIVVGLGMIVESVGGIYGYGVGPVTVITSVLVSCEETGRLYPFCRDQRAAFEEGLARAERENKLLLVDVGADWCPWCVKLQRHFSEPGFRPWLGKNVVVVTVTHSGWGGMAVNAGGQGVIRELRSRMRSPASISAIPAVFVVHPGTGRALKLDLDQAEGAGGDYDVRKLRSVLEERFEFLRKFPEDKPLPPRAPGREA